MDNHRPRARTIGPRLFRPGLRRTLLLFLLTLWLLILAAIEGSVYYFVSRTEHAGWQDRQADTARNAQTTLFDFLQRVKDALDAAGTLSPVYLRDDPAVLHGFIQQNPTLLELVRLDAHGQVVAAAFQDTAALTNAFTIPQSQWFGEAQQGRLYLGSVEVAASGKPYMIIAMPVANGGVVAARLDMHVLWVTVADLHVGQTGRVYVVGHDGQVLAHPDSQVVLNNTTLAGRPELQAFLSVPNTLWNGTYTNFTGQPVAGTLAQVPEADWIVVVEVDRAETTANSRTAQWAFGVGFLLFGAVMLALSVTMLERYLLRRVENLRNGVERLGHGDLRYRLAVSRQDEIDQVAQAFNEMAGRLDDMIRREQDQRTRLEAAVRQYQEHMGRVARGDLAARLSPEEIGTSADDPLVALGRNMNEAAASLQQMTARVRKTSASLSSAATEILAAVIEQADGANEQSAAITQVSATIAEVSAIAERTSQRAQGVASLSQRTFQVGEQGLQAVDATVAGVRQIESRVRTLTANVLALAERTQAIEQIIAVVGDLAKQSNLLSLNAAVEAARAGEAGKGFAIVAGEVRRLAEGSRLATVQVREIISQVQAGVEAAVEAAQEGMREAQIGVQLVGEAGAAIRQLAESVGESAAASAQIAAAAGQQLAGMSQVVAAIDNIQQVAGQTADSTRQTGRAAAELNDLALTLQYAVEQYHLG